MRIRLRVKPAAPVCGMIWIFLLSSLTQAAVLSKDNKHKLVKRQYAASPSRPVVSSYTTYNQSPSSSGLQPGVVYTSPSSFTFAFGGQPSISGPAYAGGSSSMYGSSSSSSSLAQYGTSGSQLNTSPVVISTSYSSPPSSSLTFYGGSTGSSSAYTGNPSALINTLYGNQYAAPAPSQQYVSGNYNGASGISASYQAGSPPTCAQAMYNVTIPDSTPVGSTVVTVLATDPRRLPLTYVIADAVFGSFSINAQTGAVTVASNLVNFARSLEFTVQVTNSQNQQCSSLVHISFIQTAALTAAPAPYSSGYGSPPASLISTPTPYNPYPAVVTVAPYGSPSAALINTPAPYNPYPAVVTAAPYGSPSAPLINTPAPYNPYPAVIAYTAAPAIYAPPAYPTAPAPVTFSTPYGSPSGNLVATVPPPAPVTFPNYVNVPPIPNFPSSYGGGSPNLIATTQAPSYPVTFPNYFPTQTVPSSFGYGTTPYAVTFPTVNPYESGNSGSLIATTPNPYGSPAPYPGGSPSFFPGSTGSGSQPSGNGVAAIRNDNGGKALGSDGFPSAPLTQMNWSFFLSGYSGTSTSVGSVGDPTLTSAAYSISGNPFFIVSPTTGNITLAPGYCPPASPTQELLSVQATSPSGANLQGNVSVVVISSPAYLQSCKSAPVLPPTPPSVQPTQAPTQAPVTQPGTVTVAFTGDTAFTVSRCDAFSATQQPAASFRARFSPNVDFNRLRITVSNSLFQPALPVVCDQNFVCNITIAFTRPVDASLQGSYLVSVNLEGGGLNPTAEALQVAVRCNDPQADQPPVPPRRGIDPSLVVPDLQSCGNSASIPVDVSEDMPVGSVIATLPQTNAQGFRYQILDASANGYFDISDQGALAISSPLSEPVVDSVHLRVGGTMGGQTVCALDVYIGIQNVNRNKPQFDQPSYNFAIDCSTPNSAIGSVTATDIDSGRNNIRRFFVSPEDTSIVSVDPASGNIHLRSKISESTSFTIFVENPGTTMRSSASVQLSCTGDNSIVMLGGASGRSAASLFRTTTPGPTLLRSAPKPRPVMTSNKPASFPFTVSMAGGRSSQFRTNTSG